MEEEEECVKPLRASDCLSRHDRKSSLEIFRGLFSVRRRLLRKPEQLRREFSNCVEVDWLGGLLFQRYQAAVRIPAGRSNFLNEKAALPGAA